jgi:hypothetical protein
MCENLDNDGLKYENLTLLQIISIPSINDYGYTSGEIIYNNDCFECILLLLTVCEKEGLLRLVEKLLHIIFLAASAPLS